MVRLWDLTAPPAAEPIVLKRNDVAELSDMAFDPSGRWVVTAHVTDTAFWPLPDRAPRVLSGHERRVISLEVTPDGKWLVSASSDGTLKAWPLSREADEQPRTLLRAPMYFPGLALDPDARPLIESAAS